MVKVKLHSLQISFFLKFFNRTEYSIIFKKNQIIKKTFIFFENKDVY